jgi:hypothetical protein
LKALREILVELKGRPEDDIKIEVKEAKRESVD